MYKNYVPRLVAAIGLLLLLLFSIEDENSNVNCSFIYLKSLAFHAQM